LCQKYGRLTLKVSLDQDNSKEFDIDLTLSYPSTSLKCTVPKTNKNTEVSMLCRIQKEFSDSSGILIEQTTIKKKNKEILLIKGFKSENSITCYNYNKKKTESAEKKKESKYTFLQMNNFNTTKESASFNLFIYSIVDFSVSESIIVTVIINIANNRNRLRHLEEVEVEAECTPDKNYEKGNVKLECKTLENNNNDFSKSVGLNIDSEAIAGIPDTADPAKTDIEISEGLVPNYNKEEVFKNVLPIIDVVEINGESCGTNGLFTIKGKSNEVITKKENITNFDIELLNPSASSFCNISSSDSDKNIELICGSKNDFDINDVAIEKQTVQKDSNLLFILNSATSSEPFNCIISSNYDLNELPKKETNNTDGGENGGETGGEKNNTINKRYIYKKASSGLSGGAIAAIIIACAVAVIATAIVLLLIRSGKLLPKKPELTDINNSSTANANIYNP
jgi:hypothetical protein